MTAWKTFVCLPCGLLLAALAGFSQAQPADERLRSACVFPVADLSRPVADLASVKEPSPEEVDRAESLFSAISAELAAAGFQLVPESQWRTAAASTLQARDFVDPDTAVKTAAAAGADLAVSAFYTLRDERILVSVSCYDARTGELVAGFMNTWRYNLGLYSTLHGEVRDLLTRLDQAPATPEAAASAPATPQLLPALTFTSSQEGMEVLLGDGRSVGTIGGGKLVVAAPGTKPGEPLLVEKRLAGYHTAWQRVRSAPVIALTPLARRTTFATEACWTLGQVIGAGTAMRLYLVPDFTFIALSVYPYGQSPASGGGNWLFHLDVEFSAGSYLFFPPESLFRLGASTGFGIIGSHVIDGGPGVPSYYDEYLNIINVWLELSLPGISFFVRPESKFMLGTAQPNLLGRNIFLVNSQFPPITLGALVKW